ncbi:MAG: hypothetical protein HYR84_01620 [Planctomycetes bacterium]|nr:hypothetical protein [Planctomycetota bacterium]
MSTTLASPGLTIAPHGPAAAVAAPAKTWLVGPWFDLFFLANLAWPIAVLAALFHPLDETNPISLFQIYFLSTPHRWITLVMVFFDSERFWKEPAKFGGLGLLLVGLGLALVGVAGILPYAADSLMLLMMLDYVWNAWHFAAQHAGIARIYGRIVRPDQTPEHAEFEKSAIRTLVLWVFFRLAIHIGTTTAYGDNVRWLTPWLGWIDPLALIPAGVLVFREVASFQPQHLGRALYIGSVLALYLAQLLAIRLESGPWMMAFFFAGAVFHAVEYLAVCNWSVQKRTTGIWHYQITRTGLALVVFMALLGAVNYFVNAQSVYVWHGIIWKAKPAPA